MAPRRELVVENGDLLSGTNGSGNGREWIVVFAVFLMQVAIPSILSSYGVLLIKFVEVGSLPFWSAVWTPAVFSATWCFVDPWSRIFSTILSPRCIAAVGIGSIVAAQVLTSFVHYPSFYFLTYGLIGGLGASLAMTQAEIMVEVHFQDKRGIARGICHVGIALGQFIAPLMLLGIIKGFTYTEAPLLHACFVLQTFIGIMFFKNEPCTREEVRDSGRPRAYTMIEDDDALTDDSSHGLLRWRNNACRMNELPSTIWNNQRDPFTDISSPNSRRKNHAGVEILPKIVEEDEGVEEDEDVEEDEGVEEDNSGEEDEVVFHKNVHTNGDSLKFVSDHFDDEKDLTSTWNWGRSNARSGLRGENVNKELKEIEEEEFYSAGFTGGQWSWSNNNLQLGQFSESDLDSRWECGGDDSEEKVSAFQGFNSKYLQVPDTVGEGLILESETDYSRDRLVSSSTDNGGEEINIWLPSPSNFSCPMWCTTHKAQFKKVLLPDLIKRPIFYPVLLANVAKKLSILGFAILTPAQGRHIHCTEQESAFLVSVAGFSWLCFLVTSPWFSKIVKKRRKYLYTLGSLVTSVSFYLMSVGKSQEWLTFGSVLFGIGEGAMGATYKTVAKEALGESHSAGAEGIINTITAVILLLEAAIIGAFSDDPEGYSSCFTGLCIVQLVSSVVWLFLPIVSTIRSKHREYGNWGKIIATSPHASSSTPF